MKPDLITCIQDLPSPLALVLEEYRLEKRAYVKLHRLIDAAEMATRFLFIVAITDGLQQLDPLPQDLKGKLAKELSRPSFGKWKELLNVTLKSLHDKERTCFIPELPTLWIEVWQPLIGSNEDSYETAILPLRNHVAHVRITDEAAQQLMEPIQCAFENGFQQLAVLFQNYQLIAVTNSDVSCVLRGVPQPGNLQPYANPMHDWEPGLVYLVDNNAHSLKLFPLHLYHDVLEKSEVQYSGGSISASMIYLQYNPRHDRLEFTVLSPITSYPHFWQSEGRPLQVFSEIFKIKDWEDEQKRYQDTEIGRDISARMIAKWKYDFEDLENQYPDLYGLYGRKQQLSEIQKRIKSYPKGRYLWLNGAPGVGKSAFMFGLRQRMRTDKKSLCLSFFFRLGDVRCAPEHFYRAMLLRLKQTSDETSPLKDQFQAAVRQYIEQSNKLLLFLLDGMDEIAVVYPDFVSEVLASSAPGIVWICAGRSLAPNLDTDIPGESYVLRPLTKEDVRAWLTHDLEREKYALFERDVEQSDGGSRNSFIDALVTRSEGIPLYITLALEDLRAGRLSVMDEDRLPQGLAGYYDQLLERLKVSDVSSVLTDVLALLSWALEPLAEDTIEQILAPQYADDAPDWKKLIADTMHNAAIILRSAPTPEQTWGWTLYHDSLRTHLQNTSMVATARRRAQRLLLTWCSDWEKHQHPYAIRQYAQHLIEKDEWDTLRKLLLVPVAHQPWAEVRYELEQRYGGYLEDLAELEKYAQENQNLALQIECALVRATLYTIIPFKWDLAKTAPLEVALDHVRHALPGYDQVNKLQYIIQQHKDNLPFAQILDIIGQMPPNKVRAEALAILLSVPAAPLSEVQRLSTDLGETEWVFVMTRLLPHLEDAERQQELLSKIKTTIHQMQDVGQRITRMLDLASCAPEPLKCDILRDTRRIAQAIQDEEKQANELKKLSVIFRESGDLDDALITLQAIKSKFDRAIALAESIPALPATWREEASRDAQNAAVAISDPKLRNKALSFFVTPRIDGFIWEREELWEAEQTDVLVKTSDLTIGKPDDHLWEFDELWELEASSENLAMGREIGDEIARLKSMSQLSRHLPAHLREQVASQILESVRKIRDLQDRISTILELWHDLPASLQESTLTEVLSLTSATADATYEGDLYGEVYFERDGWLEKIALYSAQLGCFQQAVDIVCKIDYELTRVSCLFEITHYLPSNLYTRVFEIALATSSVIQQGNGTMDSQYKDSVWEVIAVGLAEFGWCDEALVVARRIDSVEWLLPNLLIKLAGYFPDTLHHELVTIARSVPLVYDMIDIFLELIPYLSEHEQKKLVDETLILVRRHCGEGDLAHGLIRLLPYCSIAERNSLLKEAISAATAAFEVLAEEPKTQSRGFLASDLVVAGLPSEALDMLKTIPIDKQREFVPKIALKMAKSRYFSEAWDTVSLLWEPAERAEVLIEMLNDVEGDELDRMLQRLLDILNSTREPEWLEVQEAVFPKLLERGFFEDALKIAQGVDDENLVAILESSVFSVNLPHEAAEAFWRLAIQALAHQKREKLLLLLPTLAPLIIILDGTAPIVNAINIIQEVGLCWT